MSFSWLSLSFQIYKKMGSLAFGIASRHEESYLDLHIFHFSFTFLLESTKLDAFLACKLMKNACMPQAMMMVILSYSKS